MTEEKLSKKGCKICKGEIKEGDTYFMVSKKRRGFGAIRSDGKPYKPFWMCPDCFNSLKRTWEGESETAKKNGTE